MQNINNKKQKGSIATWLAIFIMIGFWVWFFNIAPLDDYQQKLTALWHQVALPTIGDESQTNAEEKLPVPIVEQTKNESLLCDRRAPVNGKQFLLNQSNVDRNQRARFYAVNEHAYPMFITFVDANTQNALGSVYLMSNQSSPIHLPLGVYRLNVQTGVDWCNASIGFNDAVHIQSEKTIQIATNQVVNLRIMPYGSSPADVMLSFTNSLGMLADGKRIQGTGSLILQRVVGGHYAVQGSINHLPVNFLLDTGATNVAVPEAFAKRAGITDCRPYKTSTANGVVDGCIANADELTIGQFTLKNIEVSYHKGMPSDTFLLGMSVIGLFKMEHSGDVMKLSR